MNAPVIATKFVTFGQTAGRLTKLGFEQRNLLPIAPPGSDVYVGEDGLYRALKPETVGKVPARYLSLTAVWCGLSGWTEGLSDADWEAAQSWPTDSIGHLADGFPALDCDVNDGSPHAASMQQFCHEAIANQLGTKGYGIRGRNGSKRRLFMFRAAVPGAVQSVPDALRVWFEGDVKPHVIEILGRGKQYVIEGGHPRGGRYEWKPGNEVSAAVQGDAVKVATKDFETILSDIEKHALAAGAVRVERGNAKSGGGTGELHDYSNDDPILPVEVITEGLKHLPANNEQNHPYREGLVLMLAVIRAAYGRHAEEHEAEVMEWATAEDWADDEYFQHIWDSQRGGVKVDQWALEAHFRKAGYHEAARYAFPDDPELAKHVAASNNNYEATVAGKKARLKRRAAAEYAFGLGNTRSSRSEEKKHRVRHVGSTESEEYLADWWGGKSPNSRTRKFVAELQTIKDWDKDPTAFLTEMVEDHPEAVYAGETLDPTRDIGDMVEEKDKHGNTRRRINMRAIPQAQKLGAALTSYSCDNHPDVLNVEKFIQMMFREHAKYELDTIAWMAQSKRRPGNMLILQGDPGTGKSTYVDLLSLLFDGPFSTHKISGVTLARQDGLKYALMALIGGRIGQFVEMLDNPPEVVRKILDSLIKQLVDTGSGGDTFEAEGKFVQAGRAKNWVRLVATTNFRDVLNVGAQDRRLFVVQNGITLENRDDDGDWFDKVLIPIVTDEKRLARVWRALLDRDVSKYDPTKPPPQTLGLLEAKAIGIPDPFERIFKVVVETLKRAGRRLVDADELWELARAAAYNGDQNTTQKPRTAIFHLFDERTPDGTPKRPAAGATRSAFAKFKLEFPVLTNELKGEGVDIKKRLPTVYVAKADYAPMQNMKKPEIMDALEKDRARAPIAETSFPPMWAGPITAPAPAGKGKPRAADEFDDHNWG